MKPTPVTQAPTQAVIQVGCTLVERRMITIVRWMLAIYIYIMYMYGELQLVYQLVLQLVSQFVLQLKVQLVLQLVLQLV